MATKTISIDLEAYDCLVKARRSSPAGSAESFSKVIKRLSKGPDRGSGQKLWEKLQSLPVVDDGVEKNWDTIKDLPLEDPWQDPRKG